MYMLMQMLMQQHHNALKRGTYRGNPGVYIVLVDDEGHNIIAIASLAHK